jgi:hypothetical protein
VVAQGAAVANAKLGNYAEAARYLEKLVAGPRKEDVDAWRLLVRLDADVRDGTGAARLGGVCLSGGMSTLRQVVRTLEGACGRASQGSCEARQSCVAQAASAGR